MIKNLKYESNVTRRIKGKISNIGYNANLLETKM